MSVQTSCFLVTGGAGFIGSHLVDALLEQGAREVRVLDNLRGGSWDNLADAQARYGDRLVLIEEDFSTAPESALRHALQGVDYLYHLAAEKHQQSVNQPELVLQVNVTGTYRLLQAASQAKVQKVIFTSSLYAYGTMSPPTMEESQVPKPNTVYGISKLTGEQLLHHFYQQYNLRYTTLRLFFTYGPRQFAGLGYKSVILKHFEAILQGKPPTIFGDGTQALDYIYIDDVVRALLLSLSPRADQATLNISNGQPVSINTLTQVILRITHCFLEPIQAPPDWTAGSYRVGNSAMATQRLRWIPATSLENGLIQVYNWLLRRKKQATTEPPALGDAVVETLSTP